MIISGQRCLQVSIYGCGQGEDDGFFCMHVARVPGRGWSRGVVVYPPTARNGNIEEQILSGEGLESLLTICGDPEQMPYQLGEPSDQTVESKPIRAFATFNMELYAQGKAETTSPKEVFWNVAGGVYTLWEDVPAAWQYLFFEFLRRWRIQKVAGGRLQEPLPAFPGFALDPSNGGFSVHALRHSSGDHRIWSSQRWSDPEVWNQLGARTSVLRVLVQAVLRVYVLNLLDWWSSAGDHAREEALRELMFACIFTPRLYRAKTPRVARQLIELVSLPCSEAPNPAHRAHVAGRWGDVIIDAVRFWVTPRQRWRHVTQNKHLYAARPREYCPEDDCYAHIHHLEGEFRGPDVEALPDLPDVVRRVQGMVQRLRHLSPLSGQPPQGGRSQDTVKRQRDITELWRCAQGEEGDDLDWMCFISLLSFVYPSLPGLKEWVQLYPGPRQARPCPRGEGTGEEEIVMGGDGDECSRGRLRRGARRAAHLRRPPTLALSR